MKSTIILVFLYCLFFTGSAFAEERKCASNLVSLRELFKDPKFPLRWTETTMDDGKPLLVEIREEKGALFLEFIKSKEGLWAAGTADICEVYGKIVATISKDQIKLGKAAHWVLKMSMSEGAKFKLELAGPALLKISTTGWHSDFVPTPTP